MKVKKKKKSEWELGEKIERERDGGGREWASMLKFHTLPNLWLKNYNSNTNLPRAEQEFDKVNFEKMNPLPTLSRAVCGLAWATHWESVLSHPCKSYLLYNHHQLNYHTRSILIANNTFSGYSCKRALNAGQFLDWGLGRGGFLCCWDIDRFAGWSEA